MEEGSKKKKRKSKKRVEGGGDESKDVKKTKINKEKSLKKESNKLGKEKSKKAIKKPEKSKILPAPEKIESIKEKVSVQEEFSTNSIAETETAEINEPQSVSLNESKKNLIEEYLSNTVDQEEDKKFHFNKYVDCSALLFSMGYKHPNGYHSDPEMVPDFKSQMELIYKQGGGVSKSMNDVLLHRASYPEQVFAEETQNVKKLELYQMDEKVRNSWKKLADLENNRYSYFDELFKSGFVIDTMETPANPEDPKYLVEANKSSFEKKIDYGRLVFKTKNVYTGNLNDWYFHGPGRYSWVDGTLYQGDFKNGQINGEGIIVWPEGSIFEGETNKGNRDGWGVYSSPDGGTYAGDWNYGLPHGYGKMWYDGDSETNSNNFYIGHWRNGKPHGKGVRQYTNGDRYMGQWEKGGRYGYGVMIWLEERQVYRGNWNEGVPDGQGEHFWYLPRTKYSEFPARHVYKGEFKEGMRYGIGRMIYPCGSIYEGRWENGQRDGKGAFINPAGDVLIGLFSLGSIKGGIDVPLHAPTYEFDYQKLVESLAIRFDLFNEDKDEEEESLKKTTIKYILQIRQLYKRAGEIGHWWGNHGFFPEWMKKNGPSTDKKFNEWLNEECHFRKGRNASKFIAPDGVTPLTKMGLWLLLKDCPGITEDVTLSHFDNIWSSIPSISFQTKHNPFEPIYLWQFLQCLIAVAAVYYIEIPERKRILRIGFKDVNIDECGPSKVKSQETSVTTSKNELMSNSSSATSITDSQNSQSQANIESRLRDLKKLKEFCFKEGNKKKKICKQLRSICKESNKKAASSSFKKNKTNGRSKYKAAPSSSSNLSQSATTLNSSIQSFQSSIGANDEEGGREIKNKFSSDVELPFVDPSKEGLGVSIKSSMCESILSEINKSSSGKNTRLGNAFELLLKEKLIPYLNKAPGNNIPTIPNPLPALDDLFAMFKSLSGEQESLTALEFIQRGLDYLKSTEEYDIYWNRSLEKTRSIDLDPEFVSTLFKTKSEENLNALPAGFLGDSLSNFEIYSKELQNQDKKDFTVKVLGDPNREFKIICRGKTCKELQKTTSSKNVVSNSSASLLEEKSTNSDKLKLKKWKDWGEKDKKSKIDEMLYNSSAFDDKDLVQEPFLWTHALKYKQAPDNGNLKAYLDLSIKDVILIIKYLYPKITGNTSSSETNLNFEIIFCDWLWILSLCAQVSNERLELLSGHDSQKKGPEIPQKKITAVSARNYEEICKKEIYKDPKMLEMVKSMRSEKTGNKKKPSTTYNKLKKGLNSKVSQSKSQSLSTISQASTLKTKL